MNLELNDKVAFVTGASGGIGQELVSAFVAEGARVAAQSRRAATASERVLPVTADVRVPAEMDAAMQKVLDAWGRVDVCVANAGIWPPEPQPLDRMPEARIRDVIEVDLLGALWTARAFMGALRRCGPRRDGHGASLILIGSTAGRFGERGHVEYAVAKAGLRGLLLSLKNEIVEIDPRARVNLVEPGWTVTPMAGPALSHEGAFEAATRTMPLRQLAMPADVSNAVLFLASPVVARHLTGEILMVAGGMEGRVLWEASSGMP